jgi:hypothetical protein
MRVTQAGLTDLGRASQREAGQGDLGRVKALEIRSGLNPGDHVIQSTTAQYEAFGRVLLR